MSPNAQMMKNAANVWVSHPACCCSAVCGWYWKLKFCSACGTCAAAGFDATGFGRAVAALATGVSAASSTGTTVELLWSVLKRREISRSTTPRRRDAPARHRRFRRWQGAPAARLPGPRRSRRRGRPRRAAGRACCAARARSARPYARPRRPAADRCRTRRPPIRSRRRAQCSSRVMIRPWRLGQLEDQRLVERPHEARVHDRRLGVVAGAARRRRARRRRCCPSARIATSLPRRSTSALPRTSGASGSSHFPLRVAARVADPDRTVDPERELEHRRDLGLVARRHQRHVGKRAQVGDVVEAHVGRTVVADRGRRDPSRRSPASSESRRRGRLDRRRAAGTSSRSRTPARSPLVAAPAAKQTACASAIPTSK